MWPWTRKGGILPESVTSGLTLQIFHLNSRWVGVRYEPQHIHDLFMAAWAWFGGQLLRHVGVHKKAITPTYGPLYLGFIFPLSMKGQEPRKPRGQFKLCSVILRYQLFFNIHPTMEDADNLNPPIITAIEDYVATFRQASITWPDFVAFFAQFWMVDKITEWAFQLGQIGICLFTPPVIVCIAPYLYQISISFRGKPVPGFHVAPCS